MQTDPNANKQILNLRTTHSFDEARGMLAELSATAKAILVQTFGSTHSISPSPPLDLQKRFETATVLDGRTVVIAQSYLLTRGWREGAIFSISWPAPDAESFFLSAYGSSRLEEQLQGLFILIPGVIGFGSVAFSENGQLLMMFLAGAVGAITGLAIYLVLGVPIISLALGRKRAENQSLAEKVLQTVYNRIPRK